MSDREELAEVIEKGWGNPNWDGETLRPIDRTLADAILDSDWLAKHDAEIQAEAWEEGFDAGERDMMLHESKDYDTPCIANPYRASAAE